MPVFKPIAKYRKGPASTSISSLPSCSELGLSLFSPSAGFGKMEPRGPSLDRPVSHPTANHDHKHKRRRDSNDPEVDVGVLDAGEMLKVHAEVSAQECEWSEEYRD